MRLRSALLALTLVPAAAFTIAADAPDGCTVVSDAGTPDDETDDVLACEGAAYLSCEDAAGGKYHAQLPTGATVPLTQAAPDISFTAGAGCGTQDDPGGFQAVQPGNPYYDVTIDGFLTEGNLDTLTVELHDIYVGPERQSGEMTLNVRLEVDSQSLFGTTTLTNQLGEEFQTPAIVEVPVEPVTSETGLSEALVFSVGDLQEQFPGVGAGDGQFHTVRVTVTVPAGAHALVWGATEVPAAVHVNKGLDGTVLELGTGDVVN